MSWANELEFQGSLIKNYKKNVYATFKLICFKSI